MAQARAATKIRVCGNLPYNISSPILFHLLPFAIIEDQHFMLQKEVIDRMVAQPATADYGRLSVMLQMALRDGRRAVRAAQRVPDLPPRVDSAVVRMLPRSDFAPVDADLLPSWSASPSANAKLLRHLLANGSTRGALPATLTQRRAGGSAGGRTHRPGFHDLAALDDGGCPAYDK